MGRETEAVSAHRSGLVPRPVNLSAPPVIPPAPMGPIVRDQGRRRATNRCLPVSVPHSGCLGKVMDRSYTSGINPNFWIMRVPRPWRVTSRRASHVARCTRQPPDADMMRRATCVTANVTPKAMASGISAPSTVQLTRRVSFHIV